MHYIPHHAVLKKYVETTKLIIVYDCSSKESNDILSFNDCLETGPPLQPKLYDLLVRNHFEKLVVTGDVKRRFFKYGLVKRIEMQQPRRPINQRVSLL